MKKLTTLLLTLAMLLMTMAVPAMAEATEIELWTLFTGDDGATLTAIVDAFNASQDDVNLTHVAVDRQNLYTKLALASTSSGEEGMPDFFVTYSYDVPYYVELGYIQSWDDTISAYEAFDFGFDKYHDACAVLNMYQDQRYSISLDFPTWGMYVNNTLAAEYCPEVLEDSIVTWEEINAVGAKLAEQGVEDIAVLASGWARNDLANTYLDLAGTYVEDDGYTLALDKEAIVEMNKLWKDAYDAGYLWEEGDDGYTMFALEECIFLTGGTWSISGINEYGVDYSFIAPPQVDADENVAVFGASHAFMLPTGEHTAEEKNAMATFMHYFWENSIDWAGAGSIVASKEVAASEEYQAMPQAFVSNSYGISNPNFTWTQLMLDVLDNLNWECVYGRMTAEEYADAWVTQTEEKIAAQ